MPPNSKQPYSTDQLLQALISAESSGNPRAKSNKGAQGLMQITSPALTDYNTYQKSTYSMDDMYDSNINKQVGTWYLGSRIPQMLQAYKLSDTLENRLWAYNAGIGNVRKGIKPKETQVYIDKILKAMREGNGAKTRN